VEMFSEGVMLYRASRTRRHELLTVNYKLYDIVKRHDQSEIDKTYGKGWLRNIDGVLVPDSPKERDKIAQFEKTAIAFTSLEQLKGPLDGYPKDIDNSPGFDDYAR
jgi:hypothetical protein